MNLSENIKSIRQEKKISQSELAKRLGVEPTNYPRLEKRGNSLTYDYIELFAKALNVSIAELLNIGSTPIESKEIETLKIEIENLKKGIESANNRVKDFEVRASMYDKIQDYYLESLQFDLDEIYQDYNEGIYKKWLNDIENQEDRFNSHCFIVFSKSESWYEMAIDEFSVLRDSKLVFAWKRYKYINAPSLTMGDYQDILGDKYYKSMSQEESMYKVVHIRAKSEKYKYRDFEIDIIKEKIRELFKKLNK